MRSSSGGTPGVCRTGWLLGCAAGCGWRRDGASCRHPCSMDSQSVKAADTVGAASRGFDGGKKINGRKRHLAVDTLGLLLAVVVTAASTQDRDGACPLLAVLRERFSTITLVWADGGYAGRLVSWAAGVLRLTVTVVKRSDDTRGFVVVPRPAFRS